MQLWWAIKGDPSRRSRAQWPRLIQRSVCGHAVSAAVLKVHRQETGCKVELCGENVSAGFEGETDGPAESGG